MHVPTKMGANVSGGSNFPKLVRARGLPAAGQVQVRGPGGAEGGSGVTEAEGTGTAAG